MALGAFKTALLGAAGSAAGALGYVLLWGDPDNSGGVSAETYPGDMEFLASGTAIRVGGRFGTSASNSSRIATGNLNLSGGYSSAPTSTTEQNGWNFTHNSPTYSMVNNNKGAMWIDGSDNHYSCGQIYDASYGYYNQGVVKMSSSQSVDWNVTYKANNSNPSGCLNGVIWKSESSGYVGMMATVYDTRNGTSKQRYQMLGLDDSDGSVTHGMVAKPTDDTTTYSMTNGNPQRSNFNGDKFATTGGHFSSAGYQMIAPMLWTAQATAFSNDWTIGNQSIRNQSTSGSSIYAGGVCIDSSNNVYVLSSFGAKAISSPYTPNNVAITKYTAAGGYSWTYVMRQQAGGESTSISSGGIAISADGNDLFVTGSSSKIGGSNSSPFISKLDVSGSTPTLTWINQYASASYNCYSSNCKLIGTDTVLSFGYGQTDPTANVLGVLVAANQDGSSLGTASVDSIAWSAIDLSPYIVFADGASGGTTNVNIFNETGVTFTYATGTETTAGATPTWTNGTVTPTILVESGGIEE
jgi:hypothetical protein|tara:strand:+ start:121 stop:1692 length:1572 start_codon:yes stop_codon:yes gene_type:complete